MQPIWRAVLAAWFGLGLWCGPALPAWAADYKLSTLEWAPYTGAGLPGKGLVSATIADALTMSGYSVEVQFFPWSRAVRLVDSGPAYVGFFPAYYSRERAARYLYSDPVGRSQVVFLERTDNPVRWLSYDDLQGQRIGVVRGFVNTEALDARLASKVLLSEEAPDDRSNILKLVAGRVDLAVVDLQVYRHLVQTDPQLARVTTQLQVNPKVLEVKNLYVCFQRTPAGAIAQRALNTGLRKLRPVL
jgi:polar amino acid transport system substrate-binding protein